MGTGVRLVSALGVRFVSSMSGVIHLAEMDYHTLAIYMWEAGSADGYFAWKFSKMRSLGMSAAHTEEGKILEPPEA